MLYTFVIGILGNIVAYILQGVELRFTDIAISYILGALVDIIFLIKKMINNKEKQN